MKNLTTVFLTICFLLFFTLNLIAQNIGINSTGADPDNSALLDLSAKDKGFLITRADTAKIAKPAFGLMTLSPLDSCLYMFNGKPKGRNWISLGGVGENCYQSTVEEPEFEFEDVLNPKTGKTWMDRNLGASQAATSHDDPLSFGDLYQWGRNSDEHEKRNSGTIATLSSTDTPGHGDFITNNTNWRNPSNDNLWQGAAGINNPCPSGYRLPTEAELTNEMNSWSSKDNTGAYNSNLKLPVGGYRWGNEGSIWYDGKHGYYWSSNVSGTQSRFLYLKDGAFASIANQVRSNAQAVRCIKD